MLPLLLVPLGGLLCLAGLLGCVLPVLPGPPLNWVALLLLNAAYDDNPFDLRFLVTWAVVAAVVTMLDFVVPAWGARKAGASRRGVWGSVIGMLVGIVWFPPFGMLLGSLLGAMAGELTAGRTAGASFKAGLGVFLGTTLGMVLKLTAAGMMTWYFVTAVV